MRQFKKEFGLGVALTLAFLLLFMAFFCSGCEFFRKIDKSSDRKEDSKALDSGFVKKNEIDNKKSSEWEKTTFIPVFNKDTTINNFYIPESKAQPYIIIQEKGKADEQTKQSGVDSGWFKRIEQQLALATTKKEEVKGGLFTTGQLIVLSIIALIFVVGIFVVVKFANNLTSITALLKQK